MRPVNLLPPSERAQVIQPAGPRPWGAYGVLGALALAIVGVLLAVDAANGVRDRQAELTRVTADVQTVRTQADALQRYGAFRDLAARRVETVAGLAKSRFDWDRTLIDLSRAIPAGTHLSDLTASTSADNGGDNPLRSGVSAPAVELSGCSPSQPKVAEMLSDLRAVRGVTRVTLSKSDASSSDAQVGTADSGAGTTPAQLCPAATSPRFEVAVFFEHSAVPAAATTGAATTPTAATAATATPTPAASAAPSPTPVSTP